MFSFVSKHLFEHIDLKIWVLLYLNMTDPYLGRCNGKTQVHQILINLLKICRDNKGPA